MFRNSRELRARTPGAYNRDMAHWTVELIPDPDLGGFTARVPDIPGYVEGLSADEAIADLREGLKAYIAEFGFADALSRLNQPSELRVTELEPDEPTTA